MCVCAYIMFLSGDAGGVPNAPNITLDGNSLNWITPKSNGEPITRYTVIYKYVNIGKRGCPWSTLGGWGVCT